MNSTFDDVAASDASRFRLVLRGGTLVVLVALLGAGLAGVFEREATVVTDDGVVRVDYPATIRSGNAVELRITVDPQACEDLSLTLTSAYADVISGIVVTPLPAAEEAEADGVYRWEFTGQPHWVTLAGRAADGWELGVAGTLGVECAEGYELSLLTRRIP